MIDDRFYDIADPISLSTVEEMTGAVLSDKQYDKVMVSGVAGLENATKNDVVFFSQSSVSKNLNRPEFLDMLKSVDAAACFINETYKKLAPDKMPLLISKDPRGDFIKLQKYFYKDRTYLNKGIMKSSNISNTAVFVDNSSVFVGCNSVIEDNVQIGKNCYIGHNVVIKYGCKIGDNCRIMDGVVVSHCIMGNNVVIGEGSVIGSTGFGWHSGSCGHVRIPQIGRVILEDYVEIDCNSCIDRGAIGDTVIGMGTKIDNLVQIGHNNKIGKHCIFAGMSGVAGSSTIGNFVLAGAQSGISGFMHVADYTQISAKSGVVKSIVKPASTVRGIPAIDAVAFAKREILLKHMINKKNK